MRGDHCVNCRRPIETLAVLDARTVAYLDMLGSGAETIAHLRENGRIVIMLCAFQGAPRIVRLRGRAAALLPDDPRFARLVTQANFDVVRYPEMRRSIIVVEVDRVSDSCGYNVPLMHYDGRRDIADAWADKKLSAGGPHALDDYRRAKNATSIDGLPALPMPDDTHDTHDTD